MPDVPNPQRPESSTAPTFESLDLRPLDHTWIAGCLVAAGLSVSVVFGLLSPEGIVHFDDLTHYLYAKWAWRWPAYLLDEWGRPGFTALYFLPARLGWPACRMLSAALTACGAWLAFRIAQRMGLRHAWAVVLLSYAQPLFFQLSQTTLTETALAFYLTLAVYLAQRGRWSASAAIISIGFVTRHEAVIFLPVWIWFAWRDRAGHRHTLPNDRSLSQDGSTGVSPVSHHGRDAHVTKVSGCIPGRFVGLWRLWPIVWAPLVVNAAAPLVHMKPAILRLLDPKPSEQYEPGGWLTFFCRAMEAWGPGVMVLAMTGIGALWKKARGGGLVAAAVVVYFCMQTVIHVLGLFDSGGYARFLVAISPLVAIAALVGWQRLWGGENGCTTPRKRHVAVMLAAGSMILLWIAMERQLALFAQRGGIVAELPGLHLAVPAVRIATATLVLLAVVVSLVTPPTRIALYANALVPAGLAVMILLASYKLCHPLRQPAEAEIIGDLRQWLTDHELGGRKIISANVWLDYATGRELPPGRPSVRERLERAPVGTLFAWDEQFAGSTDHGLRLEEFTASPAFRFIYATRPAPYKQRPYLTVFEKRRPWGRNAVENTRQTAP